jgi:hypothetical protein
MLSQAGALKATECCFDIAVAVALAQHESRPSAPPPREQHCDHSHEQHPCRKHGMASVCVRRIVHADSRTAQTVSVSGPLRSSPTACHATTTTTIAAAAAVQMSCSDEHTVEREALAAIFGTTAADHVRDDGEATFLRIMPDGRVRVTPSAWVRVAPPHSSPLACSVAHEEREWVFSMQLRVDMYLPPGYPASEPPVLHVRAEERIGKAPVLTP